MIGVVGQKKGMTRIFTPEGISVPVTVIEVTKNIITQIKSISRDRYNAIQVTTGEKKNNRILKPEAGHFLKFGIRVGRGLWEFRCENIKDYTVGQEISLDIFSHVRYVDVTGLSKGKGFAGTIKRWNFRMQDATHGNSLSHRVPGSIGQNQTPGRVFKGKKMSGHLGNSKVTIQNLRIISLYKSKNIILLKGGLPGCTGSDVIIKPSIKIK